MAPVATKLSGRVAHTVCEHTLFAPGETIVVALSGGGDSVALLDVLFTLPGFSLRLVAAHLNHSLRGAESDKDEEFARERAGFYGIPFESARIDVRELSLRQGLSLEDAGRQARHAFLDTIRTKWSAHAIALAHHADDQAETVLMRLVRGAGQSGLAGMALKNRCGCVRPFLNITRSEIEGYLSGHQLPFRNDTSNYDTTFLRNRIRHELLPLLATYNPAIRNRLIATAGIVAGEDDLVESLASQACTDLCRQRGDEVSCDLSRLATYHQALRARVFRRMILNCSGSLNRISHRHLTAINHVSCSPRPNARLDLPGGITVLREYDQLTITGTSRTLSAPGEVVIPGFGNYRLPGDFNLFLEPVSDTNSRLSSSSGTACIDLDRAPFPWLARGFRNGDRIMPLGMIGTKKVKEIFIEQRIPCTQRTLIPLLFSGKTLIWVSGLRMSHTARVDSNSVRIARVVVTRGTQ